MTLTWHELEFPGSFTLDLVLGFTRMLAMRPRHGWLQQAEPLVCEVLSTSAGIRWSIGLSKRETASLLPQLRAALPGLRVEPLEDRPLPMVERAVELRLSTNRRPLRTDTSDHLARTLLTALHQVHGQEVLVLSWLVGPWLPRPLVKYQGVATRAVGFEKLRIIDPLDREGATALKQKHAEPLLGVVGRIGVQAAGPGRQRQLVQGVLGALQLVRQPGVGLITRSLSGRGAARRLRRLAHPLIAWPSLNAAEFATVLGWPIGNPDVAGITYRGSRQLPPAQGTVVPAVTFEQTPERYRVIGEATYPGREGLLQLSARDACQHLHVIGPTGSGKSVLLERLIAQDIRAGRGVVVIEPKGDLIAGVLEQIPKQRIDDVVLLDPPDKDQAVGLDLLAGDPELVSDQLVHLLRELYRDSWGPRTSQLLHAGLLLLARAGNQSLAELPLLLTNAAYRRELVARAGDPLGGGVWQWFEQLSSAEQVAVAGPSLNKLGAFLNRRVIRAIVGQTEPRFRLSQLFTERRIFLVNLAKGLIGPEAARLLGALVFAQVWQTALGRTAIPAERRHVVPVYVDEFQDYVRGLPLDFGELLAQARGLSVALTLAHQGLYQLDSETRAAVLVNSRSRLAFQTSGPDAAPLANVLGGGLTATDLQHLGAFEAYATLVHGGSPTPPVSLRTLPPLPPVGSASAARARSRAQWSRPIADVETAILERRQQPAANLGGRRRRSP